MPKESFPLPFGIYLFWMNIYFSKMFYFNHKKVGVNSMPKARAMRKKLDT